MLSIIFTWLKAIGLWLMSKENRDAGLKGILKGLEVFKTVTKLTKTKTDDKIAIFIAKQFAKAIEINGQTDPEIIKEAAKTISDVKKGKLDDVELSWNEGKVNAGIGKFGIQYDPSNGKIGLRFKL